MKFNRLRRGLEVCAVASLGLMAAPAQATNGYIANGYGGASKGMAGAGVAVPTGVLGLAQNPAMGRKVGNQAGFCLTHFLPDRSVTVAPGGPLTPGTHTSRNTYFAIPCGGGNWNIGDRASVGIFMFGNGGMNTEFATNFFAGLGAGTSPMGVNLEQAFISLNFSYQVNDRLSLGIAPVLAIQRFSATGLEAFAGMSADPANVTGNGDDWSTGLGVNLGLLYEAGQNWSFGASYRTKIDMDPFSKYAGLFADGGDFDVPAVATIGAAYTLPGDRRWTITGEYQRIFYGDIPALANSNAPPSGPLGAPGGMGFGWKDMDVLRIGAVYRANDKWTLRGGLSWNSGFIDAPSAVVNTIAPATPVWHASLGASYKINDRWGLTMSYTHAFMNDVTGSNAALTGVPQPVTIRMQQDEIAMGMTYRW